jgi:hypothetical protein
MSPVARYAGAIAAALCGLCFWSCGSSGTSAEKSTSTRSKPAAPPATTPAAPGPVPKPKLAPLGTTFTLQAGSGSGPNRPTTQLKVRATRLINRINGNFFQRGALQKGNRFVGVRLSLTNVGRIGWSGSPGDLSTLLTSSDTQAAHGNSAGGCGAPFAQKAELSPGERQRGCVVFIVARGDQPKIFQFSPNAPTTPPAEWSAHRRR